MEEKQPITEQDVQVIRETTEQLLAELEIEGTFDLAVSGEMVEVLLETQDSGMVIGRHGENLEALQLLLSLLSSRKLDHFVRISVEVGEYKKNRSAYLEQLAQETKEKVIAEQREYTLPELKPWERRIVHLMLQDDQEVVSESIGEGKDRVLVVRPR